MFKLFFKKEVNKETINQMIYKRIMTYLRSITRAGYFEIGQGNLIENLENGFS